MWRRRSWRVPEGEPWASAWTWVLAWPQGWGLDPRGLLGAPSELREGEVDGGVAALQLVIAETQGR